LASRPSRGILRRDDVSSPVATWSWWDATVVSLGAYVAGHVARLLLLEARETPTAQIAWRSVAQLIWIVVVVTWLARRGTRWATAFPRPARPWPEIRDGAVFGSILYGVVALGVALPVSWLVGLASGREAVAPEPFPRSLPPFGLALAVTLALLVAPAAEELVFRGVLFAALRGRFGLQIGVAASAAAFGLVHYLPGDPIDALIAVAAGAALGAGLAIQYERRGTLVAPLSAHVAFNAIGLVILLLR
jgi:membrane protease YdiL (CAAX protease family)